MGILDSVKSQFLDVIEFEDVSNKLLVYKYHRQDWNNEIKQGSKVIVREGQAVAFVKGGQLADVLLPGTYSLNTNNFPILSTLKAFPTLFTSPVISDVYFISTKQFIDNKWGTKNPIIKRDDEINMIRIRAFGKFAFRVINPETFMRQVFGSKGIVFTYDVITYLAGMLEEAFAEVIGESKMSVLDLATEYRSLSKALIEKANEKAYLLGIAFTECLVESLSLPDEVEKMIDEQSGIGMAKKDMGTFMQYQTARAMRDAAKQKGGLAGLGAGMAVGNVMAQNVTNMTSSEAGGKSKAEQLRELKALLDEDILTQEEFDAEKKKVLG